MINGDTAPRANDGGKGEVIIRRWECWAARYAAIAAEFGGNKAAAAAGGRVAGSVIPTGLNAFVGRAVRPRNKFTLRSAYNAASSLDGHLGGATGTDSVDPRD